MAGRIPRNLREIQFGSEFISSIESGDGQMDLRLWRFEELSVDIVPVWNSFWGDISE